MKLPGFSNVPDDIAALKDEFEALRSGEADRLQRYALYRSENQLARTGDAAQFSGVESDYTQGRRRRGSGRNPRRHDIALPFGQALTVKHSYRIAGRLPDVVVDRREETPQERYRSDTMEKMIWGVIRESRGEVELGDAAWDSSQLGAACLRVYFDYAKQMPLFKALDPSGVLVVKGLDDPHDFQRFYRYWRVPRATFNAEYREKEFRGRPVRVGDVSVDTVTIIECSDKKKTIRFTLEDGVGLDEREHDYGFVNYVVIPNIGPQRDVWGWADYEFVRALVQYLPSLLSREADILRMVANGAFVEKGTGQTPTTILDTIRKGGVLPSRKDGSIEPIQPPNVPDFTDEHRAAVIQFIRDLGFAPDAAWGDGNAGSGSDRGLQLQPLLELTAMKQLNWAAGLSRLFSMGLRMTESKQAGPARYRGAVKVGARRTPFALTIQPSAEPGGSKTKIPNPLFDPQAVDPGDEEIDVPDSPKELFDGDYEVRFVWQNRIDPDDPAFVMSELNKFQQGVQSLRTTLERLGVQSPEDEMRLIEQEADRFPWLRQGLIALTKAQLDASSQGEGGGPQEDPGTGLDAGLSTMLGKDGAAMNVDGATQGLGQSGVGQLYGGA